MSYPPNQYQQKLLQSPTTIEELSLLQRNTMTRLQFFVHNKRNFIKSTQDQFQHLRIFILSTLIKIFQSHSEKNKNRLQIFKSIIYGSKLQKLIKDYGLLKQQLHKLIAIQFNKMQVGFQAQSYLLNMFNCVAFFDEILMRAFQECLGCQNIMFDNNNNIQKLQNLILKQKFHFKLSWDRQLSTAQHQEQQDEVFLWRDENGRILRQSSLNMTFIGESSSQGSLNGSCRGSIKRKKRSKSKTAVMLQTVSVNESKSPFQFSSTFKKGRQQINNNNNNNNIDQNAIDSFHYSKGKRIHNQQQLQQQINQTNNMAKIHLIKLQQKKKKRTLWDVICCQSGQ